MIRVYTQSGSVYLIDREAKTWERVKVGEGSHALRTQSGTFTELYPIEVGRGVLMVCPPLVEGTIGRTIYTSNVTEIVDEN